MRIAPNPSQDTEYDTYGQKTVKKKLELKKSEVLKSKVLKPYKNMFQTLRSYSLKISNEIPRTRLQKSRIRPIFKDRLIFFNKPFINAKNK